jgi:hypothetical protein
MKEDDNMLNEGIFLDTKHENGLKIKVPKVISNYTNVYVILIDSKKFFINGLIVVIVFLQILI